MAKDWKVTTQASKIFDIDKDTLADLTEGESDYYLVCMTPASRWLLSSLLMFESDYYNRWSNFSGVREIDQLVATALEEMICPMTCTEDFLDLITAVQALNLSLIEIRDRLGDTNGDLDAKIETVGDNVALLTTELSILGLPDLIDKIEPMLNGVGVILGAPNVPLNGA